MVPWSVRASRVPAQRRRSCGETRKTPRLPVVPEDIEGYKQLKSQTTIPMAGGEAEFTRWGFRRLLAERVIDVAQPDTCWSET